MVFSRRLAGAGKNQARHLKEKKEGFIVVCLFDEKRKSARSGRTF